MLFVRMESCIAALEYCGSSSPKLAVELPGDANNPTSGYVSRRIENRFLKRYLHMFIAPR